MECILNGLRCILSQDKPVSSLGVSNTLAKSFSRSLSTSGSGSMNNKDDFSFFNSHIYASDEDGQFIWRRRVHLLSENRSELIAYGCNILINALYVSQSY